jgi:hypothetical protein
MRRNARHSATSVVSAMIADAVVGGHAGELLHPGRADVQLGGGLPEPLLAVA